MNSLQNNSVTYLRSGRVLPSNRAPCDSPRWINVADRLSFARIALDARLNGATHKFSRSLFELAPGAVFHGVKIGNRSSFDGPGISAYTLSLGIPEHLTKYLADFEVHREPCARVVLFCEEEDVSEYGISILLTANSAGGNLVDATSGVVDIWALLSAPGEGL